MSQAAPTVSAGHGGQYADVGRFNTDAGCAPIGTLTYKNVQVRNVTASWFPGGAGYPAVPGFSPGHTDGIWIKSVTNDCDEEDSDAAKLQSVIVASDVDIQDIEGTEGFHWEGGSARRIFLQDLTLNGPNQAHALRIGFRVVPGQYINELIFDNVQFGPEGSIYFLPDGVEIGADTTDDGPLSDYFGKIWTTSDAVRTKVLRALADAGVENIFQGADYTQEAAWVVNVVPAVPPDPDDAKNNLPASLFRSNDPARRRAVPTLKPTATKPAVLGAHKYDDGGEGLAYHIERPTDAESLPAPPGGTTMSGIDANEWFNYTFDLSGSGTFAITPIIPNGVDPGGKFHLEFDGTWTTQTFTVATTMSPQSVFLPAGRHTMRLVAEANSPTPFSVTKFNFTKTSAPAPLTKPVGLTVTTEPFLLQPTDEQGLPTRTARSWAGQVLLRWKPVAGALNYTVERRLASGGNWAVVRSRLGNTSTGPGPVVKVRGLGKKTDASGQTWMFFSDIGIASTTAGKVYGIQPATTYEYRVVAHGAAAKQESAPITVVTGQKVLVERLTTSPDLDATADQTSGSVQLQWANSDPAVEGYYVLRRLGASGSFTKVATVPARLGTNTFKDYGNGADAGDGLASDLQPGNQYDYALRAFNFLGEAEEDTASPATVAIPSSISEPQAPTDFEVTVTAGGNIHFAWGAPTDPNRAGFVLIGAGSAPITLPPTARSYDNPRRSPNSPTSDETYTLYAFNIDDYRATSDSWTGRPNNVFDPDTGPTRTAKSVSAAMDASGHFATITWARDTSLTDSAARVAGYSVERSIDRVTWGRVGLVAAGSATYSFEDRREIIPTQIYYYRVRSFRQNGQGEQLYAGLSAVVGAKPFPLSVAFDELVTMQRRPTLTGTIDGDNLNTSSVTVRIGDGPARNATVTGTDGAWTWTMTVPPTATALADNSYDVIVSAARTGGAAVEHTFEDQLVVDNVKADVPPVAALQIRGLDGKRSQYGPAATLERNLKVFVADDHPVKFIVTCVPGAKVRLQLNNDRNTVLKATDNGTGDADNRSGIVVLEYSGKATAGTPWLQVSDAAGNMSHPRKFARTLTIDDPVVAGRIPLVISGVGGASSTNPSAGDQAQVAGGNLIIYGFTVPGAPVDIAIDGEFVGTTVADGLGRWTFDYSAVELEPGFYSITAEDPHMYATSGDDAVFSVYVGDGEGERPAVGAAVVGTRTVSSGGGVPSAAGLQLSGSAAPGARVGVFQIDDGVPTLVGATTASSGYGLWSLTPDLDSLAGDTGLDFVAQVVDLDDVPIGEASPLFRVVVDATAPEQTAGGATLNGDGTAVDVVDLQLSEHILAVDGSGTRALTLADLVLKRGGTPVAWTSAQALAATDDLRWRIEGLAGLAAVTGAYTLGTASGVTLVDRAGNALAGDLAAFRLIVGTSAADSFLLRQGADASHVAVYVNDPNAQGSPSYEFSSDDTAPLIILGGGGDDALVSELSFTATPFGGLNFYGGEGNDSIEVSGTAGDDRIGIGDGIISFATDVEARSIEFDGSVETRRLRASAGADVVGVADGTINFIGTAPWGVGATLDLYGGVANLTVNAGDATHSNLAVSITDPSATLNIAVAQNLHSLSNAGGTIAGASGANVTISGSLDHTDGTTSLSGTLTATTLSLSGGTVSTTDTTIASGGSVAHSGGTLTISGALTVLGSYALSAGSVTSSGVNLGDGATASTFTHSGGTHTVNGLLMIKSGDYALSAGTLSSSTVHVGNTAAAPSTAATVTQTGGSNAVSGGIYVGNSGAAGAYTISGGGLTASTLVVANSNNGTFTQSGSSTVNIPSVYVGYSSTRTGTYNLSGGTFTTQTLVVGYNGTGVLNKTGGTLNATTYVALASGTSAAASVTLGGGSLTTPNLYVYAGTLTQSGSGTTTTVGSSLYLGYASGRTGTYNLNGGTLATTYSYVGHYGTGNFTQSAGTHTASYNLIVGNNAGSTGAYTQTGGTVNGSYESVGSAGTGTYTQSAGTHNVSSLVVGDDGKGTFTLSGGTLTGNSSSTLSVGPEGTGTVNHSGGTASFPTMFMSYLGGTSTYNLSGTGTLTVSGNAYHGYGHAYGYGYGTGPASFNQSGGTHNVNGNLYVGGTYGYGGTATYTMTAGTLNTGYTYVGYGVTGQFYQQTGSSTHTTTRLDIGTFGTYDYATGSIYGDLNLYGYGTLNVRGGGTRTLYGSGSNYGYIKTWDTAFQCTGGLYNAGSYLSDPADNYFQGVTLDTTGLLRGWVGDRFFVAGDLISHSVQNLLWETTRAELHFTAGGSTTAHRMSVTGQDFGADGDGYLNNFAWGVLGLGSGQSLELLDAYESGTAALYVNALTLSEGLAQLASIQSNGVTIYYNPDNPANAYLDGETYALPGGGVLTPSVMELAAAPTVSDADVLTGVASVPAVFYGGSTAADVARIVADAEAYEEHVELFRPADEEELLVVVEPTFD